jgi:hypothetical protein
MENCCQRKNYPVKKIFIKKSVKIRFVNENFIFWIPFRSSNELAFVNSFLNFKPFQIHALYVFNYHSTTLFS